MGAIGFVSRIIPAVYPISIIKVDPFSGEPIRDKNGLCMPCAPGELLHCSCYNLPRILHAPSIYGYFCLIYFYHILQTNQEFLLERLQAIHQEPS